MKYITLVCNAGMSTSLIVKKMKESAQKQGIEVDIIAIPDSELEERANKYQIDVVLLGPQVRYLKNKISKMLEPKGIPVEVISPVDYGTMNGKNILDVAIKLAK